MWTIVILILSLTLWLEVNCKFLGVHPEVDLTLEQRVKRHGYPVEAHLVTTEDDYYLTTYRIPYGFHGEKSQIQNKSVVVIVHGMGGSPHNFIVLGSKKGSPYYFADNGLDVWLFGSRGLYSPFKKYHKTLDWDKDDAYWMHSFHEIGKYDLSATIDFILNHTGQTKVTLIGHSAAGQAFFSMLSEKPEYNEKVNLVINWASSPVLKSMDYPLILLLTHLIDIWKGIIEITNMVEFLPFMRNLKPTIKMVCSDSELQILCTKLSWILGSHKSVMQKTNDIQVMASNIPRLSSKQLLHFMYNLRNGTFRKYDYGPKGNMKHYGDKYPPLYNLSIATIPVAFFIAPRDSAIVKEDIMDSIKLLPNTIFCEEVSYKMFTHLDFVFGQNATELVYKPTYQLIRNINDGIVYPSMDGKDSDKYCL